MYGATLSLDCNYSSTYSRTSVKAISSSFFLVAALWQVFGSDKSSVRVWEIIYTYFVVKCRGVKGL